jgi:hypothetical protein
VTLLVVDRLVDERADRARDAGGDEPGAEVHEGNGDASFGRGAMQPVTGDPRAELVAEIDHLMR